jgi:hypothetical protein
MRQRSAPMGGAAKGMPLKTRMTGADPAAPDSKPASVLTGSGTAARKLPTIASAAANKTLFFIGTFVIAYRHFVRGSR